MDAERRQTCDAVRTVKSRGPDPPTLGSSPPVMPGRRWRLTSPVLQGEREAAVKTIAQGMPFVSALPVYLVCILSLSAHKACGCGQRPAFPAPSCFLRTRFPQDSDASAPRERGGVSCAV